jgi:hypothetical protein
VRRNQWADRNKETEAQRLKLWAKDNSERFRAIQKKWRDANKDLIAAKAQRRRALQKQCLPPWADMDAIKMFFALARRVSRCTGIPHHVDHVVPLQGRHVCGLHVETNLQVLPKALNLAKGNRYGD